MREHLKSVIYNVLKDNKKEYGIGDFERIHAENKELFFVVGELNIAAFIKIPLKLSSEVHIEIDCSNGYGDLLKDSTISAKIMDVLLIHSVMKKN